MSHYMVLKTMRAMAWERAKGELYSILNTYFEMTRGTFDSA